MDGWMDGDVQTTVHSTLSDLEGRNARGQILTSDLRNYALAAWPKTNQFGTVTHVGKEQFLGGQPPPYHKGAGPKRSQISRFLCIYAYTLWRKTIKFGVVTYTRRDRVCFRRSATPSYIVQMRRAVCQRWQSFFLYNHTMFGMHIAVYCIQWGMKQILEAVDQFKFHVS